jgi:hypothetical protein
LADEDGLGPLSYQWYADDVAVANATGSTLILTEAELGKVITVGATYTDRFGFGELVSSGATVPVASPPLAPPFTIQKTIVGDTITLDFVLDPDAAALAGGPGLGSIDVQIALDPLALDYVEGSFTSVPGLTSVPNETQSAEGVLLLSAFAFPDITDFTQPLFSISATILDRLQPTTVAISGVAIDGVRSTTAPELADYTLSVELNNPVQGDVLIVGGLSVGATLQADTGALSDPDGIEGVFTYQWFSSGEEIVDAILEKYTTSESEAGKQVYVQVSFEDSLGVREVILSESIFVDPLGVPPEVM